MIARVKLLFTGNVNIRVGKGKLIKSKQFQKNTGGFGLYPEGQIIYMKYSANQGRISSFVVGRLRSE